ncbi:MAG TPA: electron transfer flavoprotein subunit beta/FixA family protein, partial [Ignavibacteriaceae bacterium]|nr:electron transfer flavoprotein subunit beta/FixA family protein [Ignavibacteriaceae bacterium]
EFAVEEALKWKEKMKAEVYVLSAGGDGSRETIRKALAMGCDQGILLKINSYIDSFAVSKILADEIKSSGCELVFCGKQSVDYDNSIVGQLIAEQLNYSCISVVVDLKIEGNKITAEREVEGGREVVESELPAVITAQKGLNEPRYASLRGIMDAKKKIIREKIPGELNNLTELIKMHKPMQKNPGKILGNDKSAVTELVRLLREEAKVI